MRPAPRALRPLADAAVATAAALLVVGVYGWRQAHAPPVSARPLPADVVLNRRLPDLMLGRTTLEGAVNSLRDAGVAVEARWGKPGDLFSELPRDTPVDLNLRRPTLRQALVDLQRQAGPRGLAYWVSPDGGVVISGWMVQNPPLSLRVYDARDLTADAVAFAGRLGPADPAIAFTQRGFALFNSPDAESSAQSLTYLIRDLVEPYAWDYIGSGAPPSYGGTGVENGRLTITQTPEAQRKVEMLLAALRAFGPAGEGR